MIGSFLKSLTEKVVTLVAAFFGGVLWEKRRDANAKAKDAKADKDIANEPSKRGSSLLDSLQRKD